MSMTIMSAIREFVDMVNFLRFREIKRGMDLMSLPSGEEELV